MLADLARFTGYATAPTAATGAERIDRIAVLERIRSALAAAQNAEMVAFARALDVDLPHTAVLLAAGRISERVAELVVAQTSHLDGEQRRLVDKQLGECGLQDLSVRRAEAVVKRCAYDHVREMPGWQVEVIDDGLGTRPHTVRTTTPTGHTYLSTADPSP